MGSFFICVGGVGLSGCGCIGGCSGASCICGSI